MDRSEINGYRSPPITAASGGTKSPLLPNYSSQSVQEVLMRLASIELSELRNEAKVECCRATRDLRSCGRDVQYVLSSCGHASLCAECSQRCDICPICRIPIAKNKNNLQLRLYYECIEADLISNRDSERFEEVEDGENQLTDDVQRLYSFFDIAMENNLVSLVCHYVRDVCMDEAAVSSDPVVAFLLDEVVVKDWCKRAFKNIISELQRIYNLDLNEMQTRLGLLLKFSGQLAGISSVVEVLESSFKDDVSAQIHDLHHLQESILKTKQHLETMMWCIRHRFLDNVRSRYANFESWRSIVRERKSAATQRAWFDAINYSANSTSEDGSLFIEDALSNIDVEQDYVQGREDELKVSSLHKDDGGLSFFRSKIEGASGCYPFNNLRAAVDILFLNGSSDLVVAKKAIFLYYLFDRHWRTPDESWRYIIDDFAATFSISRHSLLESLTFYLLDDHTEEALQEACQLLPEISGPATHPKVARVLLERQNPETALMVLRWSGRDGGSQLVSLSEAVTAVRVRVECALLTEAFTYQRMLCSKIREKNLKYGTSGDSFSDLNGESKTWEQWVEILVTEICCLCIRRNLVDRMIELPWNSEEEKHIHKCLLDYATDDASTTVGSLLVVFYLQRYRYAEAYRVNLKLQSLEQDFLSKKLVGEEKSSNMQSQSHWRTELVDTCIELLPAVEQQLVKSRKSPAIATTGEEMETTEKSGLNEVQVPKPLAPAVTNSSPVPQMNHVTSSSSLFFDTPRPVSNPNLDISNYGSSSILHETLFTEPGPKREFGVGQNFKFDNILSSTMRGTSVMNAIPLRGINNSSKGLPASLREDNISDKTSTEAEQNGFAFKSQNTIFPYPRRMSANPISTRGFSKDSLANWHSKLSGKRVHYDTDDGEWHTPLSGEPMDIGSSYGKKTVSRENRYESTNGGPRWRSDETSDEEEDQSPEESKGVAAFRTPVSTIRRSRFARR